MECLYVQEGRLEVPLLSNGSLKQIPAVYTGVVEIIREKCLVAMGVEAPVFVSGCMGDRQVDQSCPKDTRNPIERFSFAV